MGNLQDFLTRKETSDALKQKHKTFKVEGAAERKKQTVWDDPQSSAATKIKPHTFIYNWSDKRCERGSENQ